MNLLVELRIELVPERPPKLLATELHPERAAELSIELTTELPPKLVIELVPEFDII